MQSVSSRLFIQTTKDKFILIQSYHYFCLGTCFFGTIALNEQPQYSALFMTVTYE